MACPTHLDRTAI